VIPLPWERLLWKGRSALRPAAWYALTDFRLIAARPAGEIVLQDIADVARTRSLLDRAIGTSTIVVRGRGQDCPPIVLRHVRRGAQLAALLELLSGEPQASFDAAAVRAALAWEPAAFDARRPRGLFAGLALGLAAAFAIAAGMRGDAETATYGPDDPIYPRGVKREHAAIVAFMESAVMPWARQALAPITGGPDRVTCETCHGSVRTDGSWQMPGVGALPEPHVVTRGWETYSAGMDTQMRNAIYGYTAESENQAKAAYMREVVMPGMARLLRRPAYDFTRPYNYNRSRLAFGCYHCHRVR
jgi:hypothetical protein